MRFSVYLCLLNNEARYSCRGGKNSLYMFLFYVNKGDKGIVEMWGWILLRETPYPLDLPISLLTPALMPSSREDFEYPWPEV